MSKGFPFFLFVFLFSFPVNLRSLISHFSILNSKGIEEKRVAIKFSILISQQFLFPIRIEWFQFEIPSSSFLWSNSIGGEISCDRSNRCWSVWERGMTEAPPKLVEAVFVVGHTTETLAQSNLNSDGGTLHFEDKGGLSMDPPFLLCVIWSQWHLTFDFFCSLFWLKWADMLADSDLHPLDRRFSPKLLLQHPLDAVKSSLQSVGMVWISFLIPSHGPTHFWPFLPFFA